MVDYAREMQHVFPISLRAKYTHTHIDTLFARFFSLFLSISFLSLRIYEVTYIYIYIKSAYIVIFIGQNYFICVVGFFFKFKLGQRETVEKKNLTHIANATTETLRLNENRM